MFGNDHRPIDRQSGMRARTVSPIKMNRRDIKKPRVVFRTRRFTVAFGFQIIINTQTTRRRLVAKRVLPCFLLVVSSLEIFRKLEVVLQTRWRTRKHYLSRSSTASVEQKKNKNKDKRLRLGPRNEEQLQDCGERA